MQLLQPPSEEKNELCFFLFRYLKGSVLQGDEMTYFVLL